MVHSAVVAGVSGAVCAVLEVGAVSVGTVVRFNATNGYGFITPDDGGADVFLHASLLSDRFKDFVPLGTRVEYQAVQGERGPKAVGVTILSDPPADPVRRDDPDDQLCDVISPTAFAQKITEVLIDVAPSVTGAQISEVRQRLLAFARQHGWIEG
jgi:CspA family cold shock protein